MNMVLHSSITSHAQCQLLRYTIVAWDFAPLLVAISNRGLAVVSFVTDPDKVFMWHSLAISRLYRWEEDTAGLAKYKEHLLRWLRRMEGDFDAPLDWHAATDFQQRVWRFLRAIPRGNVCSYAEVARAVGRPQAVRAVARCCAANRLALIVPCHRVICVDGSLGGYRWGVEYKLRLLRYEGYRI